MSLIFCSLLFAFQIPQARHAASVFDLTHSVWHYIDTNFARYVNPTFDPAEADLGDPVLVRVCPALFALELWREYFMRVWTSSERSLKLWNLVANIKYYMHGVYLGADWFALYTAHTH